MAKNTNKRKTTNGFSLPSPDIPEKKADSLKLPYNGNVVKEDMLSFSFVCFDREHDLFDLSDKETHGTVRGNWFLDLFDCLKSAGTMTKTQLRSSMHDLHPVNWRSANVKCPDGDESLEYWQFRLNKSRGRVIGFIIDNVFYVVWLDPHHNFTDSDHYENQVTYRRPMSEYEQLCKEIERLKQENENLRSELKTADELLSDENAAYKLPKKKK